jgi:ABC-type glutathione transport system ATPase component
VGRIPVRSAIADDRDMDTALRTPTVTDPAPPARPAPARSVVEARPLTRVWGDGPAAQTAVNAVDLTVRTGEVLAIVGPSGSGKSTLGAMLAGIDRPTSGSIVACGQRTDAMNAGGGATSASCSRTSTSCPR